MKEQQNTPPGSGQPPGGIPSQDVFSMLGLQDLPEKEKKMLLGKLEKVIQEQVIHLIVSYLSDEQCKDLNEKMDKGMTQWEVIDYLRDKIPNLEEQIRKLVEDFRGDLMAEVGDIRKEISEGKTPSPYPVTDRFQKGYVQPQGTQQPTSSPIPPEVEQQLRELDQAIEQATKENNYERIVDLMNQRKVLREQWGIAE